MVHYELTTSAQLIFHKKTLLLLHIIYNEAKILVTIGGNQSDIEYTGKRPLFLTNSQKVFPSEAPVLASLSEPAGTCSLEKHCMDTEDRRNWAGNHSKNSSFALLFLMSVGKPQHNFWFQAFKDCIQFSLACPPAVHRAIWQLSSYLPATALAGAAQNAGREAKDNLRASHLPEKWEDSSPPHTFASRDPEVCSKEQLQCSRANTVLLQDNQHSPESLHGLDLRAFCAPNSPACFSFPS